MTDQVETTPTTEAGKEPAPGSPEYNEAMAAIGRSAREGSTEAPQRPENVPEKFWDKEKGQVNTEALLKSYSELEAAKGAGKDKDAGDKPAPGIAPDEGTQKVVKDAGLDWNVLNTKVAEKGDIDEADYAAFEKAGIPKDMVKRHIELEQFRVEAERASAIAYIGGQEETEKLLTWAGENLSDAEKAQYNTMLAGEHWRVAVDALRAKRSGGLKTAGEPTIQGGNAAAGSPTVGYKTRDDMRADMRNPLYFETSPKGEKFRAEVYKKTSLASWNVNQK